MSTFLKLLPLELDSVTEFMEPPVEIEPNDRLVGDMSDMDKRLWTLSKALERSSNQYQLDAKYAFKEQRDELVAKARELGAKSNILIGLMWTSIRDELELWGERNIGVRAGFKIVVAPDIDGDMPPFIKRMMLGDE